MPGAWVMLIAMLAIGPAAADAQFRAQDGPRVARSDHGTRAPAAETARTRETIDHGRDAGQLSRKQSRRLRREADQIDTLAARYGSDGMSAAEARELDTRERVLNDQVTAQRTAGFPGKARR